MQNSLLTENKIKLNFYAKNDFGNFGDLLSRYVVEKLSGRQVEKYSRKSNSTHLCAIGSILNRNEVCSPTVVWGSGFLSPQPIYKIKLTAIRQFFRRQYGKLIFLATRGKLTQKIVHKAGWKSPDIFGDPALVMPFIYPKSNEHYGGEGEPKIAVVLHWMHEEFKEKFNSIKNVNVIDINTAYDDIENFIDRLIDCDAILSSSLHGLIIANAYKKPCTRLKIMGNPIHNRADREDFKFEDYLSGLNACKVDKTANDYVLNELVLYDEMLSTTNFVNNIIAQSTVPAYKIDLTNLMKAFPFPVVPSLTNEKYIID